MHPSILHPVCPLLSFQAFLFIFTQKRHRKELVVKTRANFFLGRQKRRLISNAMMVVNIKNVSPRWKLKKKTIAGDDEVDKTE